MRKIFSFMIAALFSASMFAGTETTVYYTAPAATIGTYTVKLNIHMGCNEGDAWTQIDMVKTENTYGEDPIYSASFTDYWDGLCTMQFQLYDGETWKSQKEVFNGSWKAESAYNGKMYVHETDEWVEADSQPGDEQPAPAVTLKGSFDSWGAGFAFTPAEDKLTATLTREITANTYKFKLLVDGVWLGEGAVVTREACTDLSFASNVDDATLIADADGDYTFVYTYATHKLSVTFPEKSGDEHVINYYLVGSLNDWNTETAQALPGDSIVLDLEAGSYEFKLLTILKSWYEQLNYNDLNAECSSEGIESAGEDGSNIKVVLAEAGKVKIKVVEGKICVTGAFVVPEPVLANGYYLNGLKGWDVEDLSEDVLFVANQEQDGEFLLNVTLAKDDAIKVVRVESDAIVAWYPAEGDDYVVDEAHAGAKTIYFRPAGNEAWGAFGGYIYIEENKPTAISNTAADVVAVKFIENGQLFIRVNGAVYSILGK